MREFQDQSFIFVTGHRVIRGSLESASMTQHGADNAAAAAAAAFNEPEPTSGHFQVSAH